ncbi:MAG TPA: hypothetical protein PLZ84_08760 [Clostridia bacterium]|nr:hypothetical protein [Clostridia bacterium]
MAEIFEMFMLICFGLSWPVSIIKSYTARSAKGKSRFFLLLILFGYIFGIIAKLISGSITYVIAFYALNCLMTLIDLMLYIRNRRLDKSSI